MLETLLSLFIVSHLNADLRDFIVRFMSWKVCVEKVIKVIKPST